MKELYIAAYEELYAEAEEAGGPIDENKIAELAHERSIDMLTSMIDAAKDRAKYGN